MMIDKQSRRYTERIDQRRLRMRVWYFWLGRGAMASPAEQLGSLVMAKAGRGLFRSEEIVNMISVPIWPPVSGIFLGIRLG